MLLQAVLLHLEVHRLSECHVGVVAKDITKFVSVVWSKLNLTFTKCRFDLWFKHVDKLQIIRYSNQSNFAVSIGVFPFASRGEVV